jgi:hypothetical protein
MLFREWREDGLLKCFVEQVLLFNSGVPGTVEYVSELVVGVDDLAVVWSALSFIFLL